MKKNLPFDPRVRNTRREIDFLKSEGITDILIAKESDWNRYEFIQASQRIQKSETDMISRCTLIDNAHKELFMKPNTSSPLDPIKDDVRITDSTYTISTIPNQVLHLQQHHSLIVANLLIFIFLIFFKY